MLTGIVSGFPFTLIKSGVVEVRDDVPLQ